MRTICATILLATLFAGCQNKTTPDEHNHHSQTSVPVTQTNDMMLTDSQVKLANITTQKVAIGNIGQTISLTGRLTTDREKSEVISSRAAGRIEKLYVKENGIRIQKGQPLYTLYSETLLTLQQEYLLAKQQYEAFGGTEKRYKSFLDASEKKLLLYGVTKKQIAQLTDRSAIQPRITFEALSSGVVTEIMIEEGQYVEEGSILYKLEDNSRLWVEAELYSNETSFLKTGDVVNVRVSGSEDDGFDTKVSFISPEYRSNSQVLVMRASIDNPGLKYKSGQQVQVYLTHSSKRAIAVPVDALIREDRGSHVFVQVSNNTFQQRVVKTGLENFDQVEITAGLNEGDTVVVSGAYLLYSEIVLKKGRNYIAGTGH